MGLLSLALSNIYWCMLLVHFCTLILYSAALLGLLILLRSFGGLCGFSISRNISVNKNNLTSSLSVCLSFFFLA